MANGILQEVLNKRNRLVGGLMSGTSLDGVDAIIARLEGSGPGMTIELLGHAQSSYPAAVRQLLTENSGTHDGSPRAISQLNAALPIYYRDTLVAAAAASSVAIADVDLVGSHGQTIHHVPDPADVGGLPIRSTLQLGDPSVLANLVGTVVVGDFRTADMALGGQGAPLVPYFDYVRFADATEHRLLINLGGIANVTSLPAGCTSADVIAFDTGPANMLIDYFARRFFDRPYDDSGMLAASSTCDAATLEVGLRDPYFHRAPPKSTGRELFGGGFAERLIAAMESSEGAVEKWSDEVRRTMIATVTELTARSLAHAIHRFIDGTPSRVIVAGGGTRNKTLMEAIAATLAPVTVEPIENWGIDAAAKESLCFAVLAHELLNGIPTGLPSVTGAKAPAMQGKICLPSIVSQN